MKGMSASPVTNATGQPQDTFQERTVLLYLKNKQVWKCVILFKELMNAENPKSYISVSATAFFTIIII